MSSRPGVRVGAQAPRVRSVPAYSSSIGDEAIDFMAQVGKPLLPWQCDVIRDAYGIRPDGRWASYEVVVLEARQNGKGVITEAQELAGLYLLGEERIIHSAHLFDTSQEAFGRLVGIIESCDWLSTRTHRINRAHGKEGIELTRSAGGGKLKFKARTLHGTRGFSGDRIILDEAYALTVGQYSAISPILATLDNPQITYTSSPPDDKTGPMPDDAMLPSIRKRGLAGDPAMTFYEWSPARGFDPADVEVWYQCNPSLGHLISEEFLHRQFRVFEAAGKSANFATEHLGEWPPDTDEQWLVIPQAAWQAAKAPDEARPVGAVAFAVEVTLDRQWSSIAVAGRRGDGLRQVEVVEHRPGTAWVVDRVKELLGRWRVCAVVVAKGGPAGSLIADLEARGVAVLAPTQQEFGAAAGAFYDGVAGPERADVRYLESGPLTAAAAGAAKRKLTDGAWTWGRVGSSVDVSPLMAVTLALHGYAVKGPAGNYDPIGNIG